MPTWGSWWWRAGRFQYDCPLHQERNTEQENEPSSLIAFFLLALADMAEVPGDVGGGEVGIGSD